MQSAVSDSSRPHFLAGLYERYCRSHLNQLLAAELNEFASYYDSLIHVAARANDDGRLFSMLRSSRKSTADSVASLHLERGRRNVLFLNGNLNHQYDIEGFLRELFDKVAREDRVAAVVYNTYLRGIYSLANRLGIRKGELPSTFFTQSTLGNIARLAGFEIVRARPVGFLPFRLFGLGTQLNNLLRAIPLVRWLAFAEIVLLRPLKTGTTAPSLSIVIPARNEKGNIENALKRMPSFRSADLEVIFVEGHSTDGTWEEIQRVIKAYGADGSGLRMLALQQQGKGKADAVRLGFSRASGDLLTVLDADLTMPPELLTRFYDAYVSGKGDFINGNRLVYPMEGEAMRFLNWLGNIFFAKALSFVLETPLGDSLCGTKLVAREDYRRFVEWRRNFGDFDPFGDFELLFPACVLGLGVADVPIRYGARTYGSTNIHRFRHGFILLRMTLIGFFRIRMGLLK